MKDPEEKPGKRIAEANRERQENLMFLVQKE
jgi:hypothetical protein